MKININQVIKAQQLWSTVPENTCCKHKVQFGEPECIVHPQLKLHQPALASPKEHQVKRLEYYDVDATEVIAEVGRLVPRHFP